MNNIVTNKGTVIYFLAVILVTMFACGQTFTMIMPLKPPAVSVQITTDYCPSVEVQEGMQIAWTNMDDTDRTLIVERTNNHGEVVESGGTSHLQPGDTFAISLWDPGEYTYYCSRDRAASGTITVLE